MENFADLLGANKEYASTFKSNGLSGEADLIIAKHRNGPTRTITVSAQLHFARFSDMAPSYSQNSESFVKDN